MRILTLIAAAVLLLARPVAAQTPIVTGPIGSTDQIVFDAISNATAAQAAAFSYKVFDNGALIDTFTAPTCTGTPYVCVKTVSPAEVTALNKVGGHSVTLIASDATGGDSELSLPFVFRAPPAAPTGVRLTR